MFKVRLFRTVVRWRTVRNDRLWRGVRHLLKHQQVGRVMVETSRGNDVLFDSCTFRKQQVETWRRIQAQAPHTPPKVTCDGRRDLSCEGNNVSCDAASTVNGCHWEGSRCCCDVPLNSSYLLFTSTFTKSRMVITRLCFSLTCGNPV